MPQKQASFIFVDHNSRKDKKNARVHLVKQAQKRRREAQQSSSNSSVTASPDQILPVAATFTCQHSLAESNAELLPSAQSDGDNGYNTNMTILSISPPLQDRLLSLYLHHPAFAAYWGTHPLVSPTPQALNFSMMHSYPIIQQIVISSVAMHCLKARLLVCEPHALWTCALTFRGEAFRSTCGLLSTSLERKGCNGWEHQFAVVFKILTLEYRHLVDERVQLWRHFQACRNLVRFVPCSTTTTKATVVDRRGSFGISSWWPVVNDISDLTFPFVPAFENTQLHHLAITFEICNTTTDSLIWSSEHLPQLQYLTTSFLVCIATSNTSTTDDEASPYLFVHDSLIAQCLRAHQPSAQGQLVRSSPEHLYNDISQSHAHLGVLVFLSLLSVHRKRNHVGARSFEAYIATLEQKLVNVGREIVMETMLNLAWLVSEKEDWDETIEMMRWMAAGVVWVAKCEGLTAQERIRQCCSTHLKLDGNPSHTRHT